MNVTGDMKADFKKFRLYSRMATVFMIMAVAAFVAVMIIAIVCGDDIVKVSIAIAAMIVIGIPTVIFEYAAYDCLICPHCGQRLAKPKREAYFDKENNLRYGAILGGKPVVCVHCHREVDTK